MKSQLVLLLLLAFSIHSCGTTKKIDSTSNLKEELDEKNRGHISLLTKIRQLPGVAIKNGVPVVNKAANSISEFDSGEPLYVLNGQIIGNSFNRVNQLIDNFNVKKVKLLAGPDASIYGTQGGKGVIEITTYQ